jgi:hypothetical protein
MSDSRIRWLGGDTRSGIGKRWFCHGDNGAQEFYETIVATRVLLGIVRNHGEDVWIAYVGQGQAVRMLTGCSRRSDGKLDAEPLYGTKDDPQSLAQGLVRLWDEHGEGILSLPCTVIDDQVRQCA